MASQGVPTHTHMTRNAVRVQAEQGLLTEDLEPSGPVELDKEQEPTAERVTPVTISAGDSLNHSPSQGTNTTPSNSDRLNSDKVRIQELERKIAILETSLFTNNGAPREANPMEHAGPIVFNHRAVSPLATSQSRTGTVERQPRFLDQRMNVPSAGDGWRAGMTYEATMPSVTYQQPGIAQRLGGDNHQHPSRASSRHSHSSVSYEPRMRVPEYRGTEEWEAFWMQFSTMANYYQWDEETQLQQLIFCMRGDALTYVSQLPSAVQRNLAILKSGLEKRFGDHILPETHRAALANLRKQPKETLREYEARVRRLMSKAYPGMIGTPMFQTLEIEHLVTGLPDPNMAFDILVRKPSTVGEALNLIEWYECCKASQKRRSTVRQVGSQDPPPTETETVGPMIYNVAGSSGGKWVTEERLQQFSSELRKDIVSDIDKVLAKRPSGLAGMTSSQSPSWKKDRVSTNQMPTVAASNKPDVQSTKFTCFNCQQVGHKYRECPLPRNKAFLREVLEEIVSEDSAMTSQGEDQTQEN